jgi:hypothetical protein
MKSRLLKFRGKLTVTNIFFVANTFQIRPFHKRMQANVAFCFVPGA